MIKKLFRTWTSNGWEYWGYTSEGHRVTVHEYMAIHLIKRGMKFKTRG